MHTNNIMFGAVVYLQCIAACWAECN